MEYCFQMTYNKCTKEHRSCCELKTKTDKKILYFYISYDHVDVIVINRYSIQSVAATYHQTKDVLWNLIS